jgi:chemosensory pili system protein ChpA (sensor histidine kinase/response regulator)
MSQDKEFEIQMQFLEEASDYLNTIEGVLLEIDTSNRIDLEKINGALRAAHSIKGGAAMMGFRSLSDLAHRLEDSFKVLKTRKSSLEVDTQLQSLLLSGVDWLRQIVELHSEGHELEEQWLASFCYPVFEELHERLGDPTPEDASSMLSPEDGQDIIPLLFETEVEGCLQRLESVVADSEQPCLKEEVAIMAAELAGLGEMLQLQAFSSYCESVQYHLEVAPPEQIEEIANAALAGWRRSQALVLTSQIESLPTQLELGETESLGVILPVELELVSDSTQTIEIPEIEGIEEAETVEEIELVENTTEEDWLVDDVITADFEALEAAFAQESAASEFDDVEVHTPASVQETPATVAQPFVERKPEPAAAKSESVENTVRVPSKQLEEINDLFGELIIQRNGLNLQMERLRKLVRNLGQRVQVLDRENQHLRTAYDKISTQTTVKSTVQTLALVPGDGGNIDRNDYDSDDINNGFDALEMDRYSELNLLSQEVMETIVMVQEVTTDVQISLDDTDNISRKLNKTSKQLQRKLTQVRMRPLSDLTDRFPRALRDLCVEYGKNAQLKIEGGNILIERSILEALNDPLMHLLRNAFDHGIEKPEVRKHKGKPEQGLIEIKAVNRSNRTIITMQDDGNGISLDKIRDRAIGMGLDESLINQATDEEILSLIFEPGFTTSDQVTTLSGRGVGMDVVRNNLKQVRGDIKVDTEAEIGTTFTLSMPFTLSVSRVLLVESSRMLLAFPTDVVEEIFLLDDELVSPVGGGQVLNWQGKTLPLIGLSNYLQFNCPRYNNPDLETPPAINAKSVLIVKNSNQLVAIKIDRCWGEMEVAIRRVEGDIPLPEGFNNCTILGDGRVVALVNVGELLYSIATSERTPKNNQLPSTRLKTAFLNQTEEQAVEHITKGKGTILIVDDSINVRRFLALTLEKGGYLVEQAKDGQDALEKLQTGLSVQAVICDIEMPRVDGYGFLGRVKSNGDLKNIPVAMLTSRSSDKHRQLAMQLGARAYFSKPYNEQELLRTLDDIIFSVAGVSNSK